MPIATYHTSYSATRYDCDKFCSICSAMLSNSLSVAKLFCGYNYKTKMNKWRSCVFRCKTPV